MKTTLGFFGAGKMAEGILAAAALQKECVKEIEKMTSFNVERLNIEVREMG